MGKIGSRRVENDVLHRITHGVKIPGQTTVFRGTRTDAKPPVSLETGGVFGGTGYAGFPAEEKDGEARALRPLGGDG